MDWNNLTPIQLLALGAQTARCWAAETGCDACPLSEKNGEASCESICGLWAVEHPEEVLNICGVAVAQMEDGGTADLREHRNRLVNSVDKLQRTVNKLREENADLLKDRESTDAELERVRTDLRGRLEDERKLNDDLSTMTRAYCQEKGRADGLLEALKIIQGSQT